MPWPMWPREIQCIATGMFDRKNKACMLVCHSIEGGLNLFEFDVPHAAEGHVRVDMKRGFHYFMYIDENTTRYVNIFNSDPQLHLVPQWFINY